MYVREDDDSEFKTLWAIFNWQRPSFKSKPLPVQPTGVDMWMKNGERRYARWLLKDHAYWLKPTARKRSRLFSGH